MENLIPIGPAQLRKNGTVNSPGRGCLTGLLRGLVIVAILGGVGWVALSWALHPWIYLVGGKTRLLPIWQGVGVADTPAGRYKIYVSFFPTNSGSRILPGEAVRGTGYICAPTGERYNALVRGGANGRIWRNMDDHSFYIEVYHRPINWQFDDYRNWRPRLTFHGAWSGPNLQMTDDSSIRNAFLPDGSLNTNSPRYHDKTGAVQVTFVETNWWLPEACPKGQN